MGAVARSGKRIGWALLGAAATFYLGFHVVRGEQGMIALFVESRKRQALEKQLADVRARRVWLETRAGRMRDASVDPDLLDEQARRMLGLAGRDELIVITDK